MSEDEKKIIFIRGVLNDVATCWHIIGRSYEKLKNKEKAIEAYSNALKYSYALTYDSNWDGFWSPSKDAKAKLNKLGGRFSEPTSLKPFTLEQVLELFKSGIKQSEIKNQIEKYKVDFELTTENAVRLARVGASDILLDAIKKNHYGDLLIITIPRNNDRCGAVVRGEGRSKKYNNKFLWVFAHRSDLKNKWWPQTGAVTVTRLWPFYP